MKAFLRFLTLLVLLTGFSTQTFAQTGQYDVRFKINELNCVDSLLYIDIEVRADEPGTEFNVSDQNYRFSFNRDALANPQIVQELTLSGFVSTASPATNSFYAPHTLTGSLDTVVSYNVELSGGDGYPANDVEYIKVGRIAFDILDFNSCVDLIWHTKDPVDFPPTFIGEKFNGVLYSADEGSYGDYKQCLDNACDNVPPVAVNDSGMTPENVPITLDIPANDSDSDGVIDPTTVTLVTTPPASQGTVTVDPVTGEITFTPAPGFNGPVDPFDYQICDNGTEIPSVHGDLNTDPQATPVPTDDDPVVAADPQCAIATVFITVESVNDPPTANPDSEVTDEDTPVAIDVVGNDSDPEDGTPLDPCNVTITTPPTNGTIAFGPAPTCVLTYTPNPDYNGMDTFIYEVCDSGGACVTALVDVTINPVNDPPVAVDDQDVTDENTPVVVDVVVNDSDLEDGSPLQPCNVTITTQPDNGTVVVGPPAACTVTYIPNNGYTGVDTFEYQVCDSGGACDNAVVTITIAEVNDPPVAADDAETTPEDTPVTVPVIGNDTDSDGNIDPATVTVTTPPANGTTTVNPDGSITYTPNPDFNGTDTFAYEVCDDGTPLPAQCDEAIVTITVDPVNDPPVATDDAETTDEDTPVVVPVVNDDSDVEDGTPLDPCNVTVVTAPTNGTVSFGPAPGCTMVYTPNPDFDGPTDTYVYQVCDSEGLCDTALVTITVNPVNDPPVVVDDTGMTPEDTPVVLPVTDNDSDTEDNPFPLDPCSLTVTTAPANGTITVGPAPTCELTYTPDPDFNGEDTFVYEVCDSGGLCDTALVTVTVGDVNDPPVAEDDAETTDEDTPVIIDAVANDSDVEDGTPLDPCAVTVTTAPDNGTVSFGPPPLCVMVYTPDPNFEGPEDTFVYEVCDSGGECDTALVTITINPVNDPPVATDDSQNTPEDTPVIIPVTDNDSDVEDVTIDPCSVTITSQPTNGTIAIGPAPDCEITYTPNPDYTGPDEFEYQICDTDGLCDTATVTIDVGDVNDPPVAEDDDATTDEDTPVVIDLAGNDSDTEDGALDPCNVSILTPPTSGTITFGPPPTCTPVYTPDPNTSGVDTFVYQVCDSGGECDSATGTITVNPVNDPPVAVDDTMPTDEDTPVVIPVDTNDSDVEDTLDPCDVTITTPPANGTITIGAAPGCELTYTPDPNFNGTDTFEYQICDSDGACDEAVVTVPVGDVNDPPVAEDDAETTDEDTPVVIDAVGNDSDPEDGSPLDPCSVTIVTPPANGTVTFGVPPNCIMVYTPDPDFAGPEDTFVYEVCDSDGLCDTALVTITVNPSNDPPVAEDDSETTPEDTPVTISVTPNDSDVDGNIDPTTVTVTTPPMNGTVTVNPDGTITYTPDPDFDGTDTFTYEVCDDGTPLPAQCDEATVTVTVDPVNDPPVAEDDDETTPEDTPVTIDVTPNDSDEDGNIDPATVTVTTPPTNGTATVNPDGTITYTPDPDFDGTDTFTYEVCDDGTPLPAQCDEATVTVTVDPVNDPPVAEDDDETTPEDTPVTIDVTPNDSDEDGNIDPATVTVTTPPTNGTATVNPDGTITYTPDPDFNGTDTFTYEVCDDGTPLPAQCDEATVTVTVDPVNDPPVAEDDTEDVAEDTPTVIDVVGNDSDTEDGSPLDPCSVTVTTPPVNGTVTIGAPPACELTYTPDPGYEGTDTFTYEVCDTGGLCDTADVTINVFNTNDPPVANDDDDTTPEDTPVTVPVTGNDSDPDGNLDPTTVTILTPPTDGTTTVDPTTGDVTYTPDPEFNGTDTFLYEVCDTDGVCDTAVVTILVDPVNDPPVAEDDSETTPEDTPVIVDVTPNDSDSDGNIDPTTVTVTDPPMNGTTTVNPDGTITYTPDPDFEGTDTFTYEVCDDGTPLPAECDEATVTVTVDPVNDPPVAEDDDATTPEDTPVTIDVTPNDSDEDGNIDPATVTVTTPPTNGTVTVNPDGTITYTPDPDFNGTDSFTYEVCDDGTPLPAECDEATVTVTVDPVNDPIVAEDDMETTPEDTPVTIPVTDNDSDPEDNIDPASVTVTDPPSDGTVTVNPDGTITYTPDPDFSGTDTFTYEVCDADMPTSCDEATVTVVVEPVNDPPTAIDDFNNTLVDTPVSGQVLTNDEDPEGDGLIVNTTPVTDPMFGTVVLNSDGTYTYTPNLGSDEDDTFVYEICDASGDCDEATVYISIINTEDPGNNPPIANPDPTETLVDTPVDGDLIANDLEPDGDGLIVGTTPVEDPMNGTVVINPDGTFTYTPDPGFVGEDEFTYIVCDDQVPQLCDEAVATVTIHPDEPGNDPPFAGDDAEITPEDTPVDGDLFPNDSDPNGDDINVNSTPVEDPVNGTVVINPDGTFTYTPDPGFTGPDQFLYEICDAVVPALCDTATVYLTVTPVNDPPVAEDDDETTPEDTPVTIMVATNDSDEDGMVDPTSVTVTTPPMNGTTAVDPATGDITYTPDPDFNGTDTFAYEICDDGMPVLCDEAVVTVIVDPVNDPMVAEDDMDTTPEETPVTVPVVDNDSDTDGNIDPTTVTVTTPPSDGTATVNPDGTITYTPDPDFTGTDTFAYEVCDDGTPLPATCDEAVVTIDVTPVNDPPVAEDDMDTTPEDTPVTVPTTPNDSDSDGNIDPTTVTVTTPPMNGTVVIDPVTGDATYTPDPDFNGVDTFAYEVCDDGTPLPAQCDEAVVTIDVTPVNDPPVAEDDMDTTPEDTPVTVPTTPNDSDSDGNIDPTTVTVTTPPMNGTVVIDPVTGDATYTPDPSFSGTDTFAYEVCDDGTPLPAQCDEAVVTIVVEAVNNPPVAEDDMDTTPEDTPVTVPTTPNDSDSDGNIDPTTVTVTTPPMNGTVVIDPVTGDATYTPDPDFNGTDTFAYEVCDDGTPLPAQCDEAVVTIVVTPVNDPPVAEDDMDSTPEDTPITVPVTPNDSDSDGNIDPTTVTVTTPPMNGTVTPNPDGTITYTPDPDFTGVDTFAYEVCDDGTPLPAQCDEAVVTIDVTPVNDPPVAEDDMDTTPEDTPVTVPTTPNDSDSDGNIDPTTVTVTTPPMNGTVVIDPVTGDATYTPDPDFNGTDTFAYEVCDDGTPLPAQCDEAVVTIVVTPVNDPPVAEDDMDTTPEDTPITVPVTPNDSDTDGNIDPTTVTVTTPPMNGTVVIDPVTGDATYTPDPDFNGTDTFAYEVCDDGTPLPAQCDEAVVTIIVEGVNDAPIAVDDMDTTPEDTPITMPISDNDSDSDAAIDPSSITILTPPDNGTLVVNPDGSVTYTPDANFNGTDTYLYEICDTGTPAPVQCDDAVVTIVVTPVNDPPVAVDDSETTQQDTPVVIDVVGDDSDVEDGSPLEPCNVTLLNQPANGTAYVGAVPGCEVNYVPNAGYTGVDTFEYQVCDSDGLCDTAVVTVNITPCPAPALAVNPSPLCVDEAGTFLAASAGSGAIYNWDFGSAATPATAFGQGPHIVSFDAAGTQSVSLTVLNFGCERTETFDVEVNESPTASISMAPTELCVDELGLFTAALTSGTGATYSWDFGTDATPATASGAGGHAVSYGAIGIKTVTLTVEQNGCTTEFQQDVNIVGGAAADAGPDQIVCDGEAVQIGTSPVPGAVYVWSPATGLSSQFEANPIASPASTTTYTLFVIEGGCTTTDMVTVTVDATSVPFAEAGMDQAICEGASVVIGGMPTLDPSIAATATIAWTTDGDPASIDDATSANPTVNPITTAIYTVCVTNNTCTKCDDVTVTVNPLPAVDAGMDQSVCDGEGAIIGGNPTGAGGAIFTWSPAAGLDDPNAINPVATPTDTTVYVVTVTFGGCTATDTVVVNVEQCNDSPIAEDDFYETDQGVQLDVPNGTYPDGILINDSDPDGDNIAVVPVDSLQSTVDPTNYITILPDGSFNYFPGPTFTGTDSFEYVMCDDGTPVQCDSAVIYIVVNPCVDIQVAAFLEGPFDASLGMMSNFLNLDPGGDLLHRGLLPGQTPLNDLVSPTPAGQPYNAAPWNYVGTALENAYAGPYDPGVTDWVLVSLRTDLDPATEIVKAAGLIFEDGHIEFIEPCLLKLGDANPAQVYIAVEHRNHMGVGSPNPVDFSNGTLTWDFRIQESYRTGTGFGQKQVTPGTYVMYTGDSDQISDTFSYDITGQDNILWNSENGTFDQYRLADYDLNGDVNGADKILWSANNGISSRWQK